MSPKPGKKATRATGLLIACLLVSAAGVSIAAMAQGATAAQLQTTVQAAESSKAYATAVVSDAAANGLTVSSEQASIGSGNLLLAQAQADLASSSNLDAGILAARAAMQDYTSASVGASLLLKSAGLTTSADLNAAIDAEAEVNATASIAAQLVIPACESISAGAANATLFQESCTEAKSGIANATIDLGEAATLTAQAGVSSSDISQAFVFIAQAREDINGSTTELATISSFSYYQRGVSYYDSVLASLYAAANGSIAAQQSAQTSAGDLQNAFASNARAQSLVVANFSALATEISSVNTSPVASSVSASESITADANSNMTALLATVANLSAASLVSAIHTAQSGSTAYSGACSSAGSASAGFGAASITSFSGYLSGLDADKSTVQSTGATFVSELTAVQAQISSLIKALGVLAPPALVSANATFADLGGALTADAASLNGALTAETGAMASVQVAISSATGALASPEVKVGPSTLAAAASLASSESVYLNQSSLANVQAASSSLQTEANAAASYSTEVSSALGGTIGGFESSASTLNSDGASLKADASATTAALSSSATVIGNDLMARAGDVASANSMVSAAFAFFTNLEVSAGVSAMIAAGVDFQAASVTY